MKMDALDAYTPQKCSVSPKAKRTKVSNFTSRAFQPKAGLRRGGGVKNTLPVKQQAGFKTGTLGPQLNALTTWPQCQSNNKQQTQYSIYCMTLWLIALIQTSSFVMSGLSSAPYCTSTLTHPSWPPDTL